MYEVMMTLQKLLPFFVPSMLVGNNRGTTSIFGIDSYIWPSVAVRNRLNRYTKPQ